MRPYLKRRGASRCLNISFGGGKSGCPEPKEMMPFPSTPINAAGLEIFWPLAFRMSRLYQITPTSSAIVSNRVAVCFGVRKQDIPLERRREPTYPFYLARTMLLIFHHPNDRNAKTVLL